MNELIILLREGVDLQRREEIPTPLIEEIDAWIERAEDAIERHTTQWPGFVDGDL